MELTKRPGLASGGACAAKLSQSEAAVVGASAGGDELTDSQLRRLVLRKLRQQSAVDLVRYRPIATQQTLLAVVPFGCGMNSARLRLLKP